MEIKNEVIDKINNITKSAKDAEVAIKNLNRAMNIFCEKINMDMDEFKQRMVLKALKDGAEGNGRDYIGNLDADAADVIEKLIEENKKLTAVKEDLKHDNDAYVKAADTYRNDLISLKGDVLEYIHNRDKALDILKLKYGVDVHFELKKKYTQDEVLNIIEKFRCVFVEEMTKAAAILMDDGNSEPRNKKPIRFA